MLFKAGVSQPIRCRRTCAIQLWAPFVLAASIAADGRAGSLTGPVSAMRDEARVGVFDVRNDPHQLGMLEVAVKAPAIWSDQRTCKHDRFAFLSGSSISRMDR